MQKGLQKFHISNIFRSSNLVSEDQNIKLDIVILQFKIDLFSIVHCQKGTADMYLKGKSGSKHKRRIQSKSPWQT